MIGVAKRAVAPIGISALLAASLPCLACGGATHDTGGVRHGEAVRPDAGEALQEMASSPDGGRSRHVAPDDPRFCPCQDAPRCPIPSTESCLLRDVRSQRPELFYGARRCGSYTELIDLARTEADPSSTGYLFDARTGQLIATVEYYGEPSGPAPNGPFLPNCKCLGPQELRVGAIAADGRCTSLTPMRWGARPEP